MASRGRRKPAYRAPKTNPKGAILMRRFKLRLRAASIAVAISCVASAVLLQAQELERLLRGDSNADGAVNISVATSLLGCLFLGAACSTCPDATDANDDGSVDLSDAVRVLSWLFLGAEPPSAPGPTECGSDPTEDLLGPCEFPVSLCGPIVEDEDPVLADVLSR